MRVANLFADLPAPASAESLDELLHDQNLRIERVVSHGHCTPLGDWYDQPTDEWVLLLSGSASLRFEDDREACTLKPGDYVFIRARRKHRVEDTAADQPTIWLALHFKSAPLV